MRTLVLCHEGAPMRTSITAVAIKKIILEWPDDDADLWSVWSVPADDSMASSEDITRQFAMTWAMEIRFGDGIDPVDYLAPFPAFVREAARDRLIEKWQRHIATTDQSFVPDALRRIA